MGKGGEVGKRGSSDSHHPQMVLFLSPVALTLEAHCRYTDFGLRHTTHPSPGPRANHVVGKDMCCAHVWPIMGAAVC